MMGINVNRALLYGGNHEYLGAGRVRTQLAASYWAVLGQAGITRDVEPARTDGAGRHPWPFSTDASAALRDNNTASNT